MNVIKILIADDNQNTINFIDSVIRDIPEYQLIGVCHNGKELVEQVMLKKPDLILIEINIPFKNGIEAIKECLLFYPRLKCIFITGNNQFGVEAFRLSAIDYILKPIEKERLFKALIKAQNMFLFEQGKLEMQTSEENKVKSLPFRDQNGFRYIPLSEIHFIEKTGKKCLIYTENEIYETNETIGNISTRLDHTFFLAHRSYIINLEKVSYIKPHNETYIVHFHDYPNQASISKLKINEVRNKILALHE